MVWALFLMIYGEQIREGFNSHMIATYKTIEECDDAARKLRLANFDAKQEDKYYFLMERSKYACTVIPKQ